MRSEDVSSLEVEAASQASCSCFRADSALLRCARTSAVFVGSAPSRRSCASLTARLCDASAAMAARVTGQHVGHSWRLASSSVAPQFRHVADGFGAGGWVARRALRAPGCWARMVLLRVKGVRSSMRPGLVAARVCKTCSATGAIV